MIQGEAKVFEDNLVLLNVKTEQEFSERQKDKESVEVTKITYKIDFDTRFARFRKNLKKRSASIF